MRWVINKVFDSNAVAKLSRLLVYYVARNTKFSWVTSMANPQIVDGYTRIANELLDALIRSGLTKRELRVVLVVIRQTYGYNRSSDDISGS
ncbi:hypothetical protein AB833_10080 [Chromatiales bacterium (ex Bugula neritina AB1)]|nr:hypothetical protein AB833_10080 [Chromatiales bacterium (ex Bugula neritina AB1)]